MRKKGAAASFFIRTGTETESRSASAILLDGIVYEFRQARQVPEDTQSRIALAEELLKNRYSAQQEDNSLQND